jgi:hypothetical protein
MSKVRAVKVTLNQIIESDVLNAVFSEFVEPKKATLLSGNAGTIIQVEDGDYYLSSMGEWFRSPLYGKALPQVDAFDRLQDLNLTIIKDKLIRKDNESLKNTVVKNEQKLRVKDNVSPEKTVKTVATYIASEKKD